MAGRTYIIKNGKKTLAPTELQLRRMASELLSKVMGGSDLLMKDIGGYDGNRMLTDKVAREWAIKYLKENYTQEQLVEMLKKGKADTKDFAVMMAVRAYLDENAGIKISELHDKTSKWNREKLLEEFHDKDVEYCAVYDKNGRFIGYNIGTESAVGAWTYYGMDANGTFLHNHPTNQYSRVGGGLSIYQLTDNKTYAGDILSFRNDALKEITATGREGTYTLKRDKKVKISLKELKDMQTEFATATSVLMEKYSKIKGSFRGGAFGRAYSIEHFRIISTWAKGKGISYTFTPRKGFEDLLDIKALTKPLPPL